MLCTHKTASSASLVLEICPPFNNSFLHQFSSIFGGNCITIRDKSYMFGDNRSVVTSSTIPNSTISKRHHLASYHQVREAIAAKYISFHWKDGKSNPADILSKHWEFATVWPMLKPILFWRGETATQLKGSDRIPSTTPGAEPPRDVRDSGSAMSHSTHLETSSSGRP